jgi:dephospho-CoA kinase
VPTEPYVVALTGGIGSGKSTVAEAFQALGVDVVDADAIAHQLTAPGGLAMAAIQAEFGETMLTQQGALDRARMRQQVFSDDSARQRLEGILHPMIRHITEQAILAARSSYVIWAVPLLLEGGQDGHQRAQRVLVVDCPEHLQISRVMARSGLKRAEVEAIMARQVSRAERVRHADDVLLNDGSIDQLKGPIEALHVKYLNICGSSHQERL